jgi:molecular chaperone DnaK (HSP70)
LDRVFPGKVDHSVEKDEVVAVGACLYMAKKLLELEELGPKPPEPPPDGPQLHRLPPSTRRTLGGMRVRVKSKQTYGIVALDENDAEFNDHFIEKGAPLPLELEKKYATHDPDQRQALVQLLQGDSEAVSECKEVAQRASELPPGLPKGSPLHLTFRFTEEGMISIHLLEPSSGMEGELMYEGAEYTEAEREALEAALEATD